MPGVRSVPTSKQSRGAVKKASDLASDLASEKQREDRGRTPVCIFLNNSVCTLHLPPPSFGTARETVSRVKMLNGKMCSAGGFHTLFIHDSARAKREVIGVSVELTNHRVYQELAYRNELLKTMFTGSTSPSVPSPHAVFTHLFSMY